MSLKWPWKTTDRRWGPSGYKRKGTFRDTSLVGLEPHVIDHIDHECMEQNISRSEWLKAHGGKTPDPDSVAIPEFSQPDEGDPYMRELFQRAMQETSEALAKRNPASTPDFTIDNE